MQEHGGKLLITNLTKNFMDNNKTSQTVLDNVNVEVGSGEIVSLIGPSGCGKSTLLDIVAGLTVPDDGVVTIGSQDITGKKGYTSYMLQNDALFPWRTVLDNVIVPLEIQGVAKKEARQKAMELLPSFGLDGYADSYPAVLSGGMRQRAAFLRTCLGNKEVMLLDEPFGRLDAITRRQMQQWLSKIWEQFKYAVLLVTHDVDEAILLSDRIYVMASDPGTIVGEVKVNIPRPRQIADEVGKEYIAVKRLLLQLLEDGLTGKGEQPCLATGGL